MMESHMPLLIEHAVELSILCLVSIFIIAFTCWCCFRCCERKLEDIDDRERFSQGFHSTPVADQARHDISVQVSRRLYLNLGQRINTRHDSPQESRSGHENYPPSYDHLSKNEDSPPTYEAAICHI